MLGVLCGMHTFRSHLNSKNHAFDPIALGHCLPLLSEHEGLVSASDWTSRYTLVRT